MPTHTREPSYWVKWVAGIAATVLSALLVARFVPSDKVDSSDRVDSSGLAPGLTNYKDPQGVFALDYPLFYGVPDTFGSPVTVGVRFGNPPSGDGVLSVFKFGMDPKALVVQVFPLSSSTEIRDADSAREFYVESAKKADPPMTVVSTRNGLTADESTYVELQGGDMHMIFIWMRESNFVLTALAMADSKTWRTHRDEVRRSLASVTLSPDAARTVFGVGS